MRVLSTVAAAVALAVVATGTASAQSKEPLRLPFAYIFSGPYIEYGEREPPETTHGERYYSTPEGWGRLPTAGMVAFAIREARARLGGGS